MTELVVIRRRGADSVLNAAEAAWSDRWLLSDGVAPPVPQSAWMIVVCCDHPDAFRTLSKTIIDQFPLAEVIVAAGPWLRSFGRTRDHWPASWVMTESDAAERIRRVGNGEGTPTPRPVTWTRDERWLLETS